MTDKNNYSINFRLFCERTDLAVKKIIFHLMGLQPTYIQRVSTHFKLLPVYLDVKLS